MSYDLVFWKGGDADEPDALWDALSSGEVPASIEPLDVASALEILRGVEVRETAHSGLIVVEGHGWELAFEDPATVSHFVISCAWSLFDDDDAEERFDTVADALEASGLRAYDPQAGDYR